MIVTNVAQFMQVTFIITKQRSSIILPMLTSNLKVLQNLEVDHISATSAIHSDCASFRIISTWLVLHSYLLQFSKSDAFIGNA